VEGLQVLDDKITGRRVTHDLDRLHILTDRWQLGVSGYQAAGRLGSTNVSM